MSVQINLSWIIKYVYYTIAFIYVKINIDDINFIKRWN